MPHLYPEVNTPKLPRNTPRTQAEHPVFNYPANDFATPLQAQPPPAMVPQAPAHAGSTPRDYPASPHEESIPPPPITPQSRAQALIGEGYPEERAFSDDSPMKVVGLLRNAGVPFTTEFRMAKYAKPKSYKVCGWCQWTEYWCLLYFTTNMVMNAWDRSYAFAAVSPRLESYKMCVIFFFRHMVVTGTRTLVPFAPIRFG